MEKAVPKDDTALNQAEKEIQQGGAEVVTLHHWLTIMLLRTDLG
jgi:hypothetical protein